MDDKMGKVIFLNGTSSSGKTTIAKELQNVLQEPSWVAPCVRSMDGLEVTFVAVRCSLDVLESREKARGDLHVGMARYQYDRVHSHGTYDVEVDTSTMSLEQCVRKICEYVQSGRRPSAFDKLRTVSANREPSVGGAVIAAPQP